MNSAKLSEILGHQQDDAGVGEMLELLSQITLAVLIVFIIAAIMYKNNAMEDAQAAKDAAIKMSNELNTARTSETGTMQKELDKDLVQIQREKLLNAIDKVEAEDRERIGLATFARKDPNGSLSFAVDGILVKDKITDNPIVRDRFVNGCKFAKERIPYEDNMRRDWLTRVLLMSGLRLSDDSNDKSASILATENEQWLYTEIRVRVKAVCTDSRNLQRAVLASLIRFYIDDTEQLKDTPVYKLVKTYNSAKPEEREALANRVVTELYDHVRSVLEAQAPLMSGI